ncbi:GSCOCG00007058001-RA-CDS [Cotesia congregata]|nr:GSCOCG00007058001-RA-CDS [Cotesia congregata]
MKTPSLVHSSAHPKSKPGGLILFRLQLIAVFFLPRSGLQLLCPDIPVVPNFQRLRLQHLPKIYRHFYELLISLRSIKSPW